MVDTELVHHVGACDKSMPLNAFQDIHRCLHFADDWEEDREATWEIVYLDEHVVLPATAKHRASFGMVKGTFNTSWKEHVSYGLHITFDNSK